MLAIDTDNLMIEAHNAGLQDTPLSEGFWAMWFHGHDDEKLSEIRMYLNAHVKTESDRRRLVAKIDEAIDTSNRVLFTGNTFSNWLADAGLHMLTGGLGSIIKLVTRLSNDDQRKAFRETLHKMRAELMALKLKD